MPMFTLHNMCSAPYYNSKQSKTVSKQFVAGCLINRDFDYIKCPSLLIRLFNALTHRIQMIRVNTAKEYML